ncbi:carbon-nitrogen hydrolase family protein [Deinococcus arenicola]|uniref:Carbon-nitrogen hydrolase family protein n=1 Tax=Deinococcus arenicola TaxID=2994950 RepID=A0ABU4DR01_9DEIO|nr:carbon-nitrogen hydrolase family protein [Deinococcus sp. ZS9-10]MDV6374868.1 carbon-nitrogen hydrolase family protein [Deinococcus sp. ZS9-10]
MTVFRVAAAAYRVDFLGGWAAYAAKVGGWVAQAAEAGAEVLVFPEYAALELVALLPPELHHDVLGMRPALQALLPDFLDLHAGLARQYGVCIVAGSFPVASGENFVNRAHIFAPDGMHSWQDKLLMTRFEAEEWHISPGDGVRVFALGLRSGEILRFGVATCYDSEFPAPARQMTEGGAEVLLVPSFTGSRAGFTRVRVGSMARALEGQCYAVHAPLLADAPWSYALEDAVGRAAIYAPADHGLPEDGVVAEGGWNDSGWLIRDLDLALIRNVRADGHVLNWRDRGAAAGRSTSAETVALGSSAHA